MTGLRWGKSATIVILSLAVSTSSNLGLLISMSRNRLGPRLALGVFLRMEYNRNRRFNFVGKGVPLVGVGIGTLTVIRIALLVPSTADPRLWFPACPSPDIVLEPCSRRVLGGGIQCPVFQTALGSRLHPPFFSLLLASLKSQSHTIFIRKWQKRFPPCLACHAAST